MPAPQEGNSQAANLMEAAVITQMLASIEKGRFDQLRRYELPTSLAAETVASSLRAPLRKSHQDSFRRFLRGLAHPEPLRNFKHPGTVWRTAISPDRERLATASADRWVRVWDLKTGTEIKRYGPLAWEATAVSYSPTEPLLAVGDRDGHVTIWNTNTDEQVARTADSNGGVESLAWAPDGIKLAAGIRYQFVSLMTPNGQPLTKLFLSGSDAPRHETIRFSSDSKTLHAANAKGCITSWDLESYQAKQEFYRENPAMMHAFVALDEAEQRWLVGAPERNQLEVISTTGMASILTNVKLNGFPVSMARSPDGMHVAVASRNGGLTLCQATNNDWSQINAETWALESDSEHVTDVAWLSNESLITASSDGNVRHWTIDRLRALQRYNTSASHVCSISPGILGVVDITAVPMDMDTPCNVKLHPVSSINGGNGLHKPLTTVPVKLRDCQFLYEQAQPNHGASKYFTLVNQERIDFHDTSSGKLVDSLSLDTLTEMEPELDLTNTKLRSVSWSFDASHCVLMLSDKAQFTRQNTTNHLYLVRLEPGKPRVTSSVRQHWKLQKCTHDARFVGESNALAVCAENESGKKELRIYQEAIDATGAPDNFEVVWTGDDWVRFSFSQDARYIAISSAKNQLLDRKTGERIPFDAPPINIMNCFMDGSRLLVSVGIESLAVFHVPTRQNLGYLDFRDLPNSRRKSLTAVHLGDRLLPVNFNLEAYVGLTAIGNVPRLPFPPTD
ncbi:WD40 repeat domain-containing protein [Planctomycetaceae bacterium SH139]